MKKTKRALSLFLVLCLLVSCVSVSAFAVDISPKPENGTTTGQPFATGTGGSTNFRIPGIVTLNNGTLIAACDARWNHTGDGAGLDTIVSVSTDNGASWTYTFANYLGDNGNTYNNLSTCVIDPAIGTDGETAYLIADLFPAGIALNTSKYSPVAGKNGFDDNGNLILRDATQDTVEIGQSGYNTAAASANYNYYLDLDTLKLYQYGEEGAEAAEVEGYTVDAYFNITDGGDLNTNLFFSDSPFQPYPTDYLYMTTSTDGLEWSEPTLLNLQEPDEQTLLIGPGNGTYDAENDRMVFTAYEYTSGYQRTSLIWKDTDGNWGRSADATGTTWSSEATAVVLSDGTVRCFFRDAYSNLRYTDYVWDETANNYVVHAQEVNTAATKTYNNQLSSYLYSQQVEGKDVILVSTANTSNNSRRNGTIYAFLVAQDNSMELAYAYDIVPGTDDYYAYSCITETEDGQIALLYEGDDGGTGAGTILFQLIPFEDITQRDNDVRLNFEAVEVLTGESVDLTDNTGYYADPDLDELDTNIAEVASSGSQEYKVAAQLGSDASYNADKIDLSDCEYTFTKDSNDRWTVKAAGSDVWLYPGHTTGSGYPNRADVYSNLTVTEGFESGSFYIYSNDCDNTNQNTSYLYFDRGSLKWDRVSDPSSKDAWKTNCSVYLYEKAEGEGSAEVPGYEKAASVESGKEYLVVAPGQNGSYYALYPNTSTDNRYCQIAKILGGTQVGYTEITFTGVAVGYTEVLIGKTVYRITVKDYNEETVRVAVGSDHTFTDTKGDFSDASLEAVDDQLVTVALASGTDNTTEVTLTGLYPGSTELILGRTKYTIEVTGEVIDLELEQYQKYSHIVGDASQVDVAPDTQVADAELGTVLVGQMGADSSYSGDYVGLENCLYTFTENENGTYTVSAETEDGTIYLQAYAASNGYPNVTDPYEITVSDFNGGITLAGTTGTSYGYLFFWRDGKNYFDRTTSTSGTMAAGVTFKLYEKQASGGYQAISGKDAIVSGNAYLIVAEADSYGSFVVYPSTAKTSRYAQSLKMVDAASINFTATGIGETTARAGSTIFNITVKQHVCLTPDCVKDQICPICGETVEAIGHDLKSETVKQTCTQDGYTLHTCQRENCGYSYAENVQKAPGHKYIQTVTDATCTAMGYTSYVCETCQDSYVDDLVDALGHNLETVVTAPTHDKMGFSTTSCSECEFSFVHDYVDALEHKYEQKVTKAATCTTEGEITFTCSCGETYTQAIPMTGHSCDKTVTAPTCGSFGYSLFQCKNCDHSYISDLTDKLEHKPIVTGQKAATCTTEGYTGNTLCSVCEQVLELGTVIAPLEKCPAEAYTDVDTNAWYHEAVEYAITNKLMNGTSKTEFSPMADTTRAMMATLLYRLADEPDANGLDNPFTDVEEGAWYYDAVVWAASQKIVKGTTAATFAPDQSISREQMVTMLYRYMGSVDVDTSVLKAYTDAASVSGYAVDAFAWAISSKIINGMTETTLAPKETANRAQIATILTRYLEG